MSMAICGILCGIIGLLIGCAIPDPPKKTKIKPNCHICGKECEPIGVFPVVPNSRNLSVPEGATYLCRGDGYANPHKIMYYRDMISDSVYSEEKPDPFSEL